MREYMVYGVRQRDGDFQAFTAPVVAEDAESAPDKFLDQVENPGEFHNLEAEERL